MLTRERERETHPQQCSLTFAWATIVMATPQERTTSETINIHLIEDIIIYNPRFHIFEKFKIKAPIVP
jgi:hypothetical protein